MCGNNMCDRFCKCGGKKQSQFVDLPTEFHHIDDQINLFPISQSENIMSSDFQLEPIGQPFPEEILPPETPPSPEPHIDLFPFNQQLPVPEPEIPDIPKPIMEKECFPPLQDHCKHCIDEVKNDIKELKDFIDIHTVLNKKEKFKEKKDWDNFLRMKKIVRIYNKY